MTETEAVQAYVRKVGLRVREARKLRGMTQAQLAAHFGRSSSYVSACETGRTAFAVDDLFVAAHVLRLDVQDFTAPNATGLLRAA